MIKAIYSDFVNMLLSEYKIFYDDRLISFCLFGSVARGTMNNISDIDFLLEVEQGSLVFLDMLEDGQILYDRNDFLKTYFESWKKRIRRCRF